jgi:alpha-L-fucosidase 2
LPSAWAEGRVKGLRARGGFEVDMRWKGGALTAATLRSQAGTRCRLRAGISVAVKSGGKPVKTERPDPGVVVFDTEAGKTYVIEPATAPQN